MLLWHAILLGVIEGLTEFLPVSSTGHLLLATEGLGLTDAFSQTFAIAIQAGAMAAVFAFTWREWLKRGVWTRVLAGFLPTAVIGLLLYRLVKQYLLRPSIVVGALLVGGILIIVLERWLRHARPIPEKILPVEGMTHRQASLIGMAQTLAIVPGVSRSAASILGGLSLGLPRATVVSYAFLLAVPTIGMAAAYDLWKQRALLTADRLDLIFVGFAVSALVSYMVIRWMLRYVRTHDFTWFGVYRIAFSLLVAWWVLGR